MKKILRFTLLFAFVLVTNNQIWNNLIFQNQILTIIKVAFILAIFEILIKPVVKLLLLPINILTLGTFRLVINTVGLYLATYFLTDFKVNNILFEQFTWNGFSVPKLEFTSFFAYLVTSFTMSLILLIFNSILSKKSKK